MLIKKTICATLCAGLFLTGCSTIPEPAHLSTKSLSSEAKVLDALSMTDRWNSVPVQNEGQASMVLLTPFSLPDSLAKRPLSMELEAGATVQDVVAVLGNSGYSVILADKDAGQKDFYLPKYKGTLGGLLGAVSKASNVWFTYHDGVIHVTSKEKVTLTLPQEEALAKKVAEGLKNLGVEESAVAWDAGMVTLTLSPTQLDRVRVFLDRITKNASLVTLQVAIVNVVLDHSVKQGIDWDKLQLSSTSGMSPAEIAKALGTQGRTGTFNVGAGLGISGAVSSSGSSSNTNNSSNSGSNTGTGTGTGSTGSTNDSSNPLSALGNMAMLQAGGTGLGGFMTAGRFMFNGMFNFLETYGETETKQNVMLKTIAGTEVVLESLTQIPYVESVGVSSSNSNISNGSSGSNSNLLGEAKTAKADDGLTLKMKPTYDAAANTVTVGVDLTIAAVIAFNDLSAGNQIGQLTQPTTAKRKFNDVLRVRPGQTVVVGGITYDAITDGTSGPTFVKGTRAESKSLKVSRQTMFIVVRPTVSTFGNVVTGDEPELYQPGKAVVEDVVKKPVRTAKPASKGAGKAAATAKAEAPPLVGSPEQAKAAVPPPVSAPVVPVTPATSKAPGAEVPPVVPAEPVKAVAPAAPAVEVNAAKADAVATAPKTAQAVPADAKPVAAQPAVSATGYAKVDL